jgi:hypothetical protein
MAPCVLDDLHPGAGYGVRHTQTPRLERGGAGLWERPLGLACRKKSIERRDTAKRAAEGRRMEVGERYRDETDGERWPRWEE